MFPPEGNTHSVLYPQSVHTPAFLVSVCVHVETNIQGHGEAALAGPQSAEALYPFAITALASWDYHLTDPAAARRLREGIAARLVVCGFGVRWCMRF